MNSINDNIWNSKLINAQTSSVPSNLGYNIVNNIKYNLSDQQGYETPISYNYAQGGKYGTKVLDYDVNNRTGYSYVPPVENPVNVVANEQKQFSKQQMFEDYVNRMIYDSKDNSEKESFTPQTVSLSQASGIYERSPYFGTAENNRFDPVVAGWKTPPLQALVKDDKEQFESPLPSETIHIHRFEDDNEDKEVKKNKEVSKEMDPNSEVNKCRCQCKQIIHPGSILVINIVILVIIIFSVIIGFVFFLNAQRNALKHAYDNGELDLYNLDPTINGGKKRKRKSHMRFEPNRCGCGECGNCGCDCSNCKSGNHSKCKNCLMEDAYDESW